MSLIRNLAKQNGWRILGTFVDEFNFEYPEKMYLLDRKHNWKCPFKDTCHKSPYSEPCLFKGKGMICLRCCTSDFRVIWSGRDDPPTEPVTYKTLAAMKAKEDADDGGLPEFNLMQRIEIQGNSKK